MKRVYINQFLAILDKLKLRNNLLLIILFLAAINSCKPRYYMLPDTEVSCLNGYTYIVKFAKKEDVSNAIRKFYIQKMQQKTSEKYTVIRLPDKRSLKLDKVPPEEAVDCKLRETNYREIDRAYIYGK
jgi:hypothetical protein